MVLNAIDEKLQIAKDVPRQALQLKSRAGEGPEPPSGSPEACCWFIHSDVLYFIPVGKHSTFWICIFYRHCTARGVVCCGV